MSRTSTLLDSVSATSVVEVVVAVHAAVEDEDTTSDPEDTRDRRPVDGLPLEAQRHAGESIPMFPVVAAEGDGTLVEAEAVP